MGMSKMEEDIREKIDNRMRDSGRSYYGDLYINYYPDYPNRRAVSISTPHYISQGTYRPVSPTLPTHRPTSVTVTVTPARVITLNPTPVKKKIGYIQRDHEHYGIEIYFYHRPDEDVLNELKDNGGTGTDKRNVGSENIPLLINALQRKLSSNKNVNEKYRPSETRCIINSHNNKGDFQNDNCIYGNYSQSRQSKGTRRPQ